MASARRPVDAVVSSKRSTGAVKLNPLRSPTTRVTYDAGEILSPRRVSPGARGAPPDQLLSWFEVWSKQKVCPVDGASNVAQSEREKIPICAVALVLTIQTAAMASSRCLSMSVPPFEDDRGESNWTSKRRKRQSRRRAPADA